MRRLLLSALLIVCSAMLNQAQSFSQNQSNDQFNRIEVFTGYSYFLLERPRPIGEGSVLESFSGFNTAVTVNLKRHFGLKLDFAAYSKRYKTCPPGSNEQNVFSPTNECFSPLPGEEDSRLRTSIYNVMGGIQFKDNGRAAKFVKPFAHLLVGSTITREESRLIAFDPRQGTFFPHTGTFTDSGLAGAVGGGFDIKMTGRVDLRAIQFDYHKADVFARSTDNIRLGVGLVFR